MSRRCEIKARIKNNQFVDVEINQKSFTAVEFLNVASAISKFALNQMPAERRAGNAYYFYRDVIDGLEKK